MFMGSIASMLLFMAMFLGIGRISFISPLWQTGILLTLVGIPMAGLSALPFALIADVIDYDEQRTGRRREALFFALQGTIQKAFLACTAMAFSVLAYIGPKGEVTVFGLRCVVGLTVFVCFLALLIFAGYPLRETADRTQRTQ
jgi:GPH family glycoside/pentoside/hexuronide:cation symporter